MSNRTRGLLLAVATFVILVAVALAAVNGLDDEKVEREGTAKPTKLDRQSMIEVASAVSTVGAAIEVASGKVAIGTALRVEGGPGQP